MDERALLQYELSDGGTVVLAFHNLNDLDGCHISLDMYKANLGPVDRVVLARIAAKFQGEVLTPENTDEPPARTHDFLAKR